MIYYFGQKYIEEHINVSVVLKYTLLSNVCISDFEFTFNGNIVKCFQKSFGFEIDYFREIPDKLISGLEQNDGQMFLLGYLDPLLQPINKRLSEQKYNTGYLLIRPVNIYDFVGVEVEVGKNKIIKLPGYIVRPNIVPKDNLAYYATNVFVKNLIDAMTSLLYWNLDECVKKLITCLENYMDFSGYKGTFAKKLNIVMDKWVVRTEFPQYRNILVSNTNLLYKVRNKITHDKLFVDYGWEWLELCHKGVHTVKYIIANTMDSNEFEEIINKLVFDFTAIVFESNKVNLDLIEANIKNLKNSYESDDHYSDINDFMFRRLEYHNEVLSKFSI